MARVNFLFAMFFLILLVQMNIINGAWAGVEHINCPARCDYRCSKAGWHKACIRACNTCCQRCGCVPPGTYGNKEVCPCYANMKTHEGRLKCP